MTSDANSTVIFNSLFDESLLAFLALFTRNALTSLKLHGFQVLAHRIFFSLIPWDHSCSELSYATALDQMNKAHLLKTEDCSGTDVLKVIIV